MLSGIAAVEFILIAKEVHIPAIRTFDEIEKTYKYNS